MSTATLRPSNAPGVLSARANSFSLGRANQLGNLVAMLELGAIDLEDGSGAPEQDFSHRLDQSGLTGRVPHLRAVGFRIKNHLSPRRRSFLLRKSAGSAALSLVRARGVAPSSGVKADEIVGTVPSSSYDFARLPFCPAFGFSRYQPASPKSERVILHKGQSNLRSSIRSWPWATRPLARACQGKHANRSACE